MGDGPSAEVINQVTEQEVSQRVAELSSWREMVKSFAKSKAPRLVWKLLPYLSIRDGGA